MAWEATYLLSPVVLLLLASGSWAQDPEILQTVEGKTVSMTCWYDPSYSYSEKIWCKKVSDTICQAPVHCDSTGAEKLRFSIQQSPWFSFFTVTMTELKIQDSGTYYCGLIGNSGNNIILRTLRLVVSEGAPYPVYLFPWSVDSSARPWSSLSYSLSHRGHLDDRS
ncbi:natural cytotoxicity triggering receptor 2-like isoform X2 [Apodemus sylvaticus]|uniref:natural cytotoxicity triggering receptor 2-like isoform X2 n=1 Tax=Apodemus sylvaticus TaxID=10129 RepID=UPI002244AD0F|nr:natural cytotoxicity triggering receptor 2-like isoform X2 [Apodemus sylvaticus]